MGKDREKSRTKKMIAHCSRRITTLEELGLTELAKVYIDKREVLTNRLNKLENEINITKN